MRCPYLSEHPPRRSAAAFSRSRYGVDGNQGEGLPYLMPQSRDGWSRWGATSNFVIHPGVALEIGSLTRANTVTQPKASRFRIRWRVEVKR